MESSSKLDITILCKVVDNFGDIGFVYRLARSLSKKCDCDIRIITDNLHSFSLLEPKISDAEAFQTFEGWKIFDWNNASICTPSFTEQVPDVILECFQCGRPEWLDDILFSPTFNGLVKIINIDYLTAESYAEDFHCLKSGTRSAKVKKMNFMPGFSSKTGGLIFDTYKRPVNTKSNDEFSVLVFSYEHDFSFIVKELSAFAKTNPLHVYLASGRGKDSFMASYNSQFTLTELPFMPQNEWDAFMLKMDFLLIRGEDSLSRACLSGIPFIWHAYVQDDDYQNVKVKALLSVMEKYFEPNDFSKLSDFCIAYNTTKSKVDSPSLLELLQNAKELKKGFSAFSNSLFDNGDFTEALISFIRKWSKELTC